MFSSTTTVITLSGYPGSGKSTLRSKLAEELDADEFYAGNIFREMADDEGMSIEEFYEWLDQDPSADRKVDQRQERIMQKAEGTIIVEGRMAPFLAPDVPKISIFLNVDPEEAARRRKQEDDYSDLNLSTVQNMIEQRVATERARYRKLYDIDDHLDPSKFDIVIDTTDITPDEVLQKVLEALRGFTLTEEF